MAYTAVPTKSTGDPAYTATFINTYIKDNFAAGVPDIFTTKGDLAGGTGADSATRQAVGVNGTILQSNSGTASGFAMQIHPAKDKVTTKGDLLAATAADTLARVGTAPGYGHLIADSSQATGMKWVSNAAALAYYGVQSSVLNPWNNATETEIRFIFERFDASSAMTSSSNNSAYFTAPAAGYYFVGCNVISPDQYTAAGNPNSTIFEVNETIRVSVSNLGGAIISTVAAIYHMAIVNYSSATSANGATGADILYLTQGQHISLKAYQDSGSNLLFDNSDDLQFFVIRLGAI